MSNGTSRQAAIVVVGSLHYDVMVEAPDRPRKGETVTGQRWYPKFGGKGGNQAVAAAQTGLETRFVGAVGTDDFGEFMLDRLLQAGLALERISKRPECGTGMSVAIIDQDGDYGAVIVSGANATIDVSHFKDKALWDGAGVLILQNEIPEPTNIAAAKAARQAGVLVCLNAAPWRKMSDEFLDLVDVLVVNAIEAEEMAGSAVTDLATAQTVAQSLTAHVPAVVVTAGGQGVALATRDGLKFVQAAHPVDLISTHGAGDMFIGTLAGVLARGGTMERAVSDANLAAAQHVSTKHP
ncbi:MAG: ribokinase [Marinosulfonomonas sp.]